jgi:hypothetical protein
VSSENPEKNVEKTVVALPGKKKYNSLERSTKKTIGQTQRQLIETGNKNSIKSITIKRIPNFESLVMENIVSRMKVLF